MRNESRGIASSLRGRIYHLSGDDEPIAIGRFERGHYRWLLLRHSAGKPTADSVSFLLRLRRWRALPWALVKGFY